MFKPQGLGVFKLNVRRCEIPIIYKSQNNTHFVCAYLGCVDDIVASSSVDDAYFDDDGVNS